MWWTTKPARVSLRKQKSSLARVEINIRADSCLCGFTLLYWIWKKVQNGSIWYKALVPFTSSQIRIWNGQAKKPPAHWRWCVLSVFPPGNNWKLTETYPSLCSERPNTSWDSYAVHSKQPTINRRFSKRLKGSRRAINHPKFSITLRDLVGRY